MSWPIHSTAYQISIHRSTGASGRHYSTANYAIVKTAFFENLNRLGAQAEVVSWTPRHVTLGSCVLKKVDPLEPSKSKRIQGERFLGRRTTRGCSQAKARLGLAWLIFLPIARLDKAALSNGIMLSSMYIRLYLLVAM